jgi:hypothetical protein
LEFGVGFRIFYKKIDSFFYKKKLVLFKNGYYCCFKIMSRVSTKSKTPFCGACQKAGKKPEEYNSHWTNTKGILTCPLILSSECGYCHEFGHWTKACPKLANRAGAGTGGGWSFSKKPADKYRVSDDSVKSSSSSKQKNLFSNLVEDSDTESESESDADAVSVNEPEPIRKLGYFDKPHGRLMDWTEFCSDSDSD